MINQILEIYFLKVYNNDLSVYYESLSKIVSYYVCSAELFQSNYGKIVFALRCLTNAKILLKLFSLTFS